jgi:hypothetical protein
MNNLQRLIGESLIILQIAPSSPDAQVPQSMDQLQTISLIVNAVLALTTISFMILTYRISKKRSIAEDNLVKESKTLEKARDYIKRHRVIDYLYQDIVLLGPRNSGKTSVATLWTDPSFNIDESIPSDDWNIYERDILELDEYYKRSEEFGIDIKYERRLRIRVLDYPGEDRFRLQAIKKLPELHNPVLLLFFDVHADSTGLQVIHDNNRYYSQAFMETVKSQANITLSISKVIVVFNKADLLFPMISLEVAENRLKQINVDAINRIESLFSGKLSYLVVSALDNRGLIKLLGECGSPTLPEEVKKLFEDRVKSLAIKAREKHA